MKVRTRSFCELCLSVAIFCGVLISSGVMRAQNAATQPVGIPDDWTHHHVVYSNPGTAEDAMAKGEYEKWLKITNSPRYKIQQARRKMGPRMMELAPEVQEMRQDAMGKGGVPTKGKPKQTLTKDWSMTLGGTANATGTLSGNNATTSSTITIDSVVLTGANPVAATQIGVFATAPTPSNNPAITITNGANVLTLTTNATGATTTGTFANGPTAGTQPSITANSTEVTHLYPSSTATTSSATGTFSGTGIAAVGATVTIATGVQTLTLTAASGTNTGTITVSNTGLSISHNLVVGSVTYTFATSSCGTTANCIYLGSGYTTSQAASNIEAAINANSGQCGLPASGCFGSTTVVNPDVKAGVSTNVVTVTNTFNAAVAMTTTQTELTLSTASIAATSSGCSNSTTGTFIIGSGTVGGAANLAAAINSCNTSWPVIGATTTYTGGNSNFTVAETVLGAGSFGGSISSSVFNWSSKVSGNNGAASTCTGTTTPFTASYQIAQTVAQLAQNAVAAINACSATAGIVGTYTSGGSFTVTYNVFDSLASTLTTAGGVTNVLTFVATTAGTVGAAACNNTTGTYAWSATLSTLGTNLNAALADCTPATTGVSSVVNGNGVKLTAHTAGPGGNSIALSPTSGDFSWDAATLTGGTDGTSTTTFGFSGLTAAQVAADIATAINSNGTLDTVVWAVAGTNSSGSAEVTVYAQASGTTGDYGTGVTGFSDFTWSGSLTGSASLTAGLQNEEWFPLTYFYSLTAGQCDSASPSADYVAFNTGLAGSANQATIIAYDNLYTGCSTGLVPSLYWQYNTGTGETITTSPVVSLDGTQVAFVQSNGTTAQLVVLKWAKNPALIALTSTSSYASSSGGCTAPCMVAIAFNDSHNDTTSSPFYDYASDTIYVGDTELTGGSKTGQGQGYLHKFTNIFNTANGNTQPAEVTATFPVLVSNSNPTTSPVLDDNTGEVLIGPTGMSGCTAQPSCGVNFHEINASTGVATTDTNSFNNEANTGQTDSPLLDPSAGYAYTFTPADGSGNAAVWQYHVDSTADFTASDKEVTIGAGDTANNQFSGTFDNLYYTGATTGYLYVCGRATGTANTVTNNTIWQIPITTATNALGTPAAGPAVATAGTSCSAVSEYYNGTKDYIFFSVQADAPNTTPVPCGTGSPGCIISFDVTAGTTFTSATAANSANAIPGGTSGLVVDNAFSSPSGEGNVYFFPLSSGTCTGTSTTDPTGQGTGTCGIQVLQTNVAQ